MTLLREKSELLAKLEDLSVRESAARLKRVEGMLDPQTGRPTRLRLSR